MSDVISVESKRLFDLSQPEELVHAFVLPAGNAKTQYYKTRLSPLVLTPGKSSDHGADIVLADPNGNSRLAWIDSYKTAIGDIAVWTKPNVSTPSVPHLYVLTIGNSIPPGNMMLAGMIGDDFLTDDNAYGETHKIAVTNLISSTINTIETLIQSHNFFQGTAFGTWGTQHGEPVWCPMGFAMSWSVLPGPDFISYSIVNCAGKSIVVDSTGVLHLVYVNLNGASYNTAYHAYSSDGGKTWTSEVISTNADAPQASVGIVVDSADTLHFVWSEEELGPFGGFGEGDEHIKYRNKTSAGVWSAVEVISRAEVEGLSTICLPCIQVNHDSLTIGVAFSGVTCIAVVYTPVIQYNERSAAGVWSGYESTGLAYGMPSLDYDSSSVPHICSMSYNDGTSVYDLMYTNKTGGVWAAGTQLETDIDAISNIVFDLLGQLHVCYIKGGDIYHLRRSAAGVWGAATYVATVTLNLISIQVDTLGNCQVVYSRNGNGCYSVVDSSLTLGGEYTWYSVAGNEIGSFAVPWSHYPQVNNQFTQLSRNSNCFAFTAGISPFPATGDLLFTADDGAVIGGVSDPSSSLYISQRQRGSIDQSTIQRIISPGLVS